MIGRLFGRKKIYLSQKEIERYQNIVGELNNKAKRCRDILTTALEKRGDIRIGALQFELGVPPSRPGKTTNANKLEDDSWVFTKFKFANQLIYKSAKELQSTLGDQVWDLRDDSLRLIENDIVKLIDTKLKEQTEKPKFPDLEKQLNDTTQEFLKYQHPSGDETDDSDTTLMYLARNIVIIREFENMLDQFGRDVGSMRK